MERLLQDSRLFERTLAAAAEGNQRAADQIWQAVDGYLRGSRAVTELTKWDQGAIDEVVAAVYSDLLTSGWEGAGSVTEELNRRAELTAFFHLLDTATSRSPLKPLAENALYQLLRRWVQCPKQYKTRYADLWTEAMHHGMMQLCAGKLDRSRATSLESVRSWVETVVENKFSSLRDEDTGDEELPVHDLGHVPSREPLLQFGERLYSLKPELEQVHAVVKQELSRARTSRDLFAHYMLEFRLSLYRHLDREDRDSPVTTCQLMDIAERLVPWPRAVAGRRIASGWPTLGDTWQSLHRSFGNQRVRMTDGQVLTVVRKMAPKAGCSENTYQKWRERLHTRLLAIATSQLAGNFSEEVMKFWRYVALS